MWLKVKGLDYLHPMARQAKAKPSVGHFVKEWRKFRGLTQERLAGRLEVSVGLVGQWETGKTKLTEDMIHALALALQCDAGDIMSRDPNSPDYQLWRIIQGVPPGPRRDQALRVIEALLRQTA